MLHCSSHATRNAVNDGIFADCLDSGVKFGVPAKSFNPRAGRLYIPCANRDTQRKYLHFDQQAHLQWPREPDELRLVSAP